MIVQPLLPPYLLSCHLPGFVQEEMIVFVHGQLFSELGEASCYLPNFHHSAQWEESFFPKTSVAIVILFWLKWAGYLAVAGLNLLAQLSDRRSPYGV